MTSKNDALRGTWAKDATPSGIAEAFKRQAQATRWGPLGPIDALPIFIPAAQAAAARRPVGTSRSAHVANPVPRPKAPPQPIVVIAGLAARYDAVIVQDGVRSVFARGAFSPYPARVDACIDHYRSLVVGSTQDGSLRLFDEPNGLGFELALTSAGAKSDVLSRVQRGDLWSVSVRFGLAASGFTCTGDLMVIHRAELKEISLLSRSERPLDSGATVGVELACVNCRKHGLVGYVHLDRSRITRCEKCGMRYER